MVPIIVSPFEVVYSTPLTVTESDSPFDAFKVTDPVIVGVWSVVVCELTVTGPLGSFAWKVVK